MFCYCDDNIYDDDSCSCVVLSQSVQNKQESLLQRLDELDRDNESLRSQVAELEDSRDQLLQQISLVTENMEQLMRHMNDKQASSWQLLDCWLLISFSLT